MGSALLRVIVMACCFALAIPNPATAQTGGTIRDIRVEGNQRIEDSTVESYLTIQRGDSFDSSALDQSLKNLFATGLFDDVIIRQNRDVLVINVVENPIINRIAFEGNRSIDDDVLTAEVQLRPRVVFTRARVQNAVSRILELYRRNGRYAARVEPKVIELEQNRVDLVFEINDGPSTEVTSIAFIGNEKFSDNTLRGVVSTKESAFYRVFSSSDTYDPDRVAFDEQLLRRFYLARGYIDFAVISTLAELTPEGDNFFITFTVEEGEQYQIGALNIDSRLRDLPNETIREFVQTEPGDVYNADLVEETIQDLTEQVGNLGYAFVEIQPQLVPNPDTLTVDVTYVIDEGPRVYIERIDITGNVRTLDEVIRREFRLAEGDAFNAALLRRSEQRIRNLGFFERVEVDTLQGSAPDRIVVDVAVTEQSTGELSFGAGFSTTDGALGDVRLSERNLLGRGQRLEANFTISGRRQDIELSFTEPYFLDRDIAAGFDIFRSQTDFQSESSFDETNLGGTLRASYPLTEFLRHGVRYTLREDEIQNVDNTASVFIQQEEGSRVTSQVGQTFTYNRTDVNFLPSEGYRIRLDQDVAGLGGDNKFLRHEGRGDYYYSLFPDVVLNFGFAGGYIFGLGDEDVGLANRFFLGGSRLRGFEFGGLGPRDGQTNDALGGNAYYVGTTEMRFPLGLPEELRIFGRVFAEGGTLTEIDVNGPTLVDSGNFRGSVGVGFSWLSPLGPLSIDLSEAIIKDREDQTELFRLSFGTRF